MIADALLYIAAGAAVGLAIGMTGVGGGSLMTPILLAFGFPLHIAVGTDLLYATLTKAGGVLGHARQGTVVWRVARDMLAGSLPAALVTLAMLHLVFSDAGAYTRLITTSLGVMLLGTALVVGLRLYRGTRLTAGRKDGERWVGRHARGLSVLSGAFLGVLVTLSSVGAGAIGTAVLLGLYPRLSGARVVGTDLAHAVPLTLVGGLGHMLLGNVDFALLTCLLIGSLPAIHLGTRLAIRLPDRVMQTTLAMILAALGVRFAFY